MTRFGAALIDLNRKYLLLIGGKKLDLEELCRKYLREGRSSEHILETLTGLTGSGEAALAILQEVTNSENIPDGFLKTVCEVPEVGFSAFRSGLGCRGEGDFLIHRTIADIIGDTGAVVDSKHQDDGGVVRVEAGFISAAVDGMHSRLSHFPFLAGFHAARAAVRDVIVMGARPVAMLADIHIANDGDIGSILDYTAGASAVAELLDVPLVGGSTLRIGGDMVRGDRITGCMVGIGTGQNLTARYRAEAGDLLVMTEGYGGGTITTTALYNGYPEVLLYTLNVKTMLAAMKLNRSPISENVHAMTDITNGGIRGDAHEFGSTAEVKVILERERIEELIPYDIMKMLTELEIDPLGISIDSLLFTIPPAHADRLIQFLSDCGVESAVVGRMEPGSGVHILEKDERTNTTKGMDESGESDGKLRRLPARFREAPYTPVKKVLDQDRVDLDDLREALLAAEKNIREKKMAILDWIRSRDNE